jgi:hypothetical protein
MTAIELYILALPFAFVGIGVAAWFGAKALADRETAHRHGPAE